MMKKIICLLFILVTSIQAYSQSQELRGVDFRDSVFLKHLISPLDSALLRRNSTLYSGKNAYGFADSKETIYNKWLKSEDNMVKYYPVIQEAWKYCINRLPYQLRLYRDGIDMNMWMMSKATDNLSRAKYGNEIMSIYDKQIQNVDSINAYVKRISDISSKGSIMMQKAYTYNRYIIAQDDNTYWNDEFTNVMYPMYTDAVNSVRQAFEAGDKSGGGDSNGLYFYLDQYFLYAVWNYVAIYSAPYENDSIKKISRDAARKVMLDEYNFIRDFSQYQMQTLGKDYVNDTLNVDESEDSIRVVMDKVVTPYQNLLARCTNYMQNDLKINVDVQYLEDAEIMYAKDLENYKDSLNWLNRVKILCENTVDFSPDEEYYSFYEKVCQYYDLAFEKMKKSMSKKQIEKYVVNEYYAKAKPLYDAVVAWSRTKRSANEGVIRNALLGIYYFKRAKTTDPGNAPKYQKYITWLGKLRSEAFMAGIKEGQTITVNGVTFTASFQ